MIPFGQAKNHLERLKYYLTKMQYFVNNDQKITSKQLEEQNFRQLNNQIFLPLINYILIDYSTEVYKKILDYIPNIKYLSDKIFVQNILKISIKIFNMQINLTVQQFLTNKYFQKKLQFISNLAKCVYQRTQGTKKNKIKQSSIQNNTDILNYYNHVNNDHFQDCEEETPVEIKSIPVMINIDQLANKYKASNQKYKQTKQSYKQTNQQSKQTIKNTLTNYENKKSKFIVDGQQFQPSQIQKTLQQKYSTPIDLPIIVNKNKKNKPNQQPISINYRLKQHEQQLDKNKYDEHDQYKYQQNKNDKKILTQNTKNKNKCQQYQTNIQKQSRSTVNNHSNHENCVSKQQFNELVELMKVLSETVNEISHKFTNLQSNITTQMNNMSARIIILESSVRVLKDNL